MYSICCKAKGHPYVTAHYIATAKVEHDESKYMGFITLHWLNEGHVAPTHLEHDTWYSQRHPISHPQGHTMESL